MIMYAHVFGQLLSIEWGLIHVFDHNCFIQALGIMLRTLLKVKDESFGFWNIIRNFFTFDDWTTCSVTRAGKI